MSLILDALKKVERDKGGTDSGVVVVGAVPWQGVEKVRRRAWLAGGLIAAGAVTLAVAWLAWHAGRASRPSPPLATAEATAPQTAPASAAPILAAAAQPSSPPPPTPPAPRALELPAEQGTSAHAGSAAATGSDLRLNAISEQDGRPIALIDGRLVREGDRFGDVHVLRIGADEVEIEQRGRRRRLRF